MGRWAGLMGLLSTRMVSVSGSALVPSSVTIRPLRETRPAVMISSALRREAMPAEARIFWRRVCMRKDYFTMRLRGERKERERITQRRTDRRGSQRRGKNGTVLALDRKSPPFANFAKD